MPDSANARLEALWPPVVERYLATGYERLSEMDKRFLAVFSLIGDVDNGGFEGYFCNPMGGLASEAATALDSIGSPKAAAIVCRAIAAAYPDGKVPEDLEERCDLAEEAECQDEWDRLTDDFYDLQPEILERLATYMSQSKSD